jgi:protoporphyrinogen oxidase
VPLEDGRGFTYDVSGGHILFSKDREVMQWMKDCAGGDAAFVRRDRHTKIRFGNRFVHYPFENGLGDLPEQAKFECLQGYVRPGTRATSTRPRRPSTSRAWIRWRFGEGIARHFMDPYNEKIWKRPLERSARAGWRAACPTPHRRRAQGRDRRAHRGLHAPGDLLLPEAGGFQAITDGIARAAVARAAASRLRSPSLQRRATAAGA